VRRSRATSNQRRGRAVGNLGPALLALYEVARLIKQNVPDSGVQACAQGVMDAVTTFVLAERHEGGYYQQYPY